MVTGFGVPTIVERLASFAAGASYDDLSEQARDQLRIRVLDALACAIGAVDREPVRLIRAQVEEFDHAGRCSLIGGGAAAPDRAAFLRRVSVRPNEEFSRRFPDEMPCRVRILLRDGRSLTKELADYPGFLTRGRTWEAAREKFERLAAPYTTAATRDQIAATVADLDQLEVADLTKLFAAVRLTTPAAARAKVAIS